MTTSPAETTVTEPVRTPAPPQPAATKRARVPKRRPHGWPVTFGVLGVVVFCLAPFYWMVVSSLRRSADIFDKSPLPSPLSFENYDAVFQPSQGFLRALLNSLVVSGTTTVLALLIATLTAYAMARLDFPAKRLVLTAIIATSMFPVVSIVVPLLKMFTDIGWINTYQAIIAPTMSFTLPLAVWILTAFFRQIPIELEHAAMVDGCTRAQAFRRIVLPLAAPGVFTTAIITFIAAWNEFLIALTMTNKPSMATAPVAISKFVGASEFQVPFGSQMAAGVLVTIPLVILVVIFQRRIVDGLTAGAVK